MHPQNTDWRVYDEKITTYQENELTTRNNNNGGGHVKYCAIYLESTFSVKINFK